MSQEEKEGHLPGLFAKHKVSARRNLTLEQFAKKRIEREFINPFPSCFLFSIGQCAPHRELTPLHLRVASLPSWVSAWEVRPHGLPCGVSTMRVEVEGILGI